MRRTEPAMESTTRVNGVLIAGLSAGAGVLLPAAAYVATLPFEDAHAFVGSVAAPVAFGSVMGVGLLCAGSRIADALADRAEHEEEYVARAEARYASRVAAASRGVPTIARAQDALSDRDAWADIDALMEDSSPVSCDPVSSRDIYEIALREMMSGGEGPAPAGDAFDAGQAPESVPADVTATFVAAASQAASGFVDARTAPVFELDEIEEPDGASIGTPAASRPSTETDLAPHAAAPAPEVAGESGDETIFEVPVADYSGHEAMWAAALDILAEDDAVASAPIGKHAVQRGIDALGDPDRTEVVPLDRLEAFAEGAQETGMHVRVNEILEDELESNGSTSVHHTSREYLRVIQGGTAAMPRISAEA